MYGRGNWVEKCAKLHCSANFMVKVTTKTQLFKPKPRIGKATLWEEADSLLMWPGLGK